MFSKSELLINIDAYPSETEPLLFLKLELSILMNELDSESIIDVE